MAPPRAAAKALVLLASMAGSPRESSAARLDTDESLRARVPKDGTAGTRALVPEVTESQERPVMRFSGAMLGDVQVIASRQNHSDAKPGRERLFTEKDRHKEFVVYMANASGHALGSDQAAVFVANKIGQYCGVGLFTQTSLTCTPISVESIETGLMQAAPWMPKDERGFGLELEFIARRPDMQGKDLEAVKLELANEHYTELLNMARERRMDVKDQVFWDRTRRDLQDGEYNEDAKMRLEELEIEGVHSCFSAAAGTLEVGNWSWTSDPTISPLKLDEARLMGAQHAEAETDGVGFELVSPVLSGAMGTLSAMANLAVLRQIGVQASPTQGLHVHINAVGNAPGEKLKAAGIVGVWMAWTKYQLVIDEMLSPGRPGNKMAVRHFLGGCNEELELERAREISLVSNSPDMHDVETKKCNEDPCRCLVSQFRELYKRKNWQSIAPEDDTSSKPFNAFNVVSGPMSQLCNEVLALPGSPEPCFERFPHQRYFQLNLVPLHKFGTLEFRAHSATYDQERVARWVQFLHAFVERFGSSNIQDSATGGISGQWWEAFQKLQQAQQSATIDDLFNDLGSRVDTETKAFYQERRWEHTSSFPCSREALRTLYEDCQGPGCGLSDDDLSAFVDRVGQHLSTARSD